MSLRTVLALASGAACVLAGASAGAATALVYTENPVTTPAPATIALPLPTDGPTLDTSQLRVRSCVDRGRTALVAPVAGTQLRACTLEASAIADVAGDFLMAPRATPSPDGAPDPAAETSAYVHAAETVTWFRALLGEDVTRAPFDVIVSGRASGRIYGGDDALIPVPRSLYLPANDPSGDAFRAYYGIERDLVWLGLSSTIDFAYDGDVVHHETAHAMLDNGHRIHGWRATEDGLTHDPEAIAEALADYVAAAMTGDPVLGELVATDPASGGGRDLAAVPPALARLTGESHLAGTAFSSALWHVRSTLTPGGARRLDETIVRLVRRPDTPAQPTMAELGAAIVDALRATDPALASTVADALRDRAILPSPRAIVEVADGDPLVSPTGAFAAPGTVAAGLAAPSIAPGLFQVHLAVPAGATTLRGSVRTVAANASMWGATPGKAFEPTAIVAWTAPITWTGSTGRFDHAIALDGAVFETALPAGAKDVWVQIASTGEEDGAFDALTLTFPDPTPAPSFTVDAHDGCDLVGSRPASPTVPGAVLLVLLGLRVRRNRRPCSSST